MDSFLFSLIIISVTGVVGAFIKGSKKDRCLRIFQSRKCHLYLSNSEVIWGKMYITSNAIELQFTDIHKKTFNDIDYNKVNYILYKTEFVEIEKIVSFVNCDDINNIKSESRELELKKLLNPNIFVKLLRKIVIFFNIVKDAIFDIAGNVMSKSKISSSNKDKILGSFKDNSLNDFSGESHQPVWEKYIGKNVIVEQVLNETKTEYIGVLKEYSANYILIYDTNFKNKDIIQSADIIFPRNNTRIRHTVEQVNI
tara:strand:- start:1497 stop:2258 length:762 start_codon:yes stop_codon:yes gene_type:complete